MTDNSTVENNMHLIQHISTEVNSTGLYLFSSTSKDHKTFICEQR